MDTDIIYEGDAKEILRELPENSVDLVVTSPPYNVGIDYGEYKDDVASSDYRLFIRDVFSELDRVVDPRGRICVNISLKNDGGIVDTPSMIKSEAETMGWSMRFETVWNKGTSESSTAWGSWRSPSSPRPIFNHEYIFTFDLSPKKRESEKTMGKDRFMSLVKSVWTVNPDTSNEHPASFPIEIPKRLIQLNSYKNDIILDPFIGSGTTAVASEKLDRQWVGIELNSEYISVAYDRIEKETELTLDGRSVFDY